MHTISLKQIHMCGGLPRSGSTVLMNILQQNPQIFTTATCALQEILHERILIRGRFSESFQAMNVHQADRAMNGLVSGATQGWFGALTDKPIVISKRHGWSNLFHLFPQSKFLCMVRDLRDVVASFEKINQVTLSLHSFNENNTLLPAMHQHEKYKYFFEESNSLSSGIVYEIPRMMEVFQRDPQRVKFVRYEDLCADPVLMLERIYNFLELEPFPHNLQKIEQSTLLEHDNAYFRERTNHTVQIVFRRSLPIKTRSPQSPLDARIVREWRWFYEAFYPEVLDEPV